MTTCVERYGAGCCDSCGRPFEVPEKNGIRLDGKTVYVGDKRIHMPLTERALFQFLVARMGSIVFRGRLFSAVWGGLDITEKVLDIYILKLRRKLADTPLEIRTSWGEGYGLFFKDPVGNSGQIHPTNPATENLANAN